MHLSLLLACQLNSSPQVTLSPKDVSPTITFQRPREIGRVRIAAMGNIATPKAVKYAASTANELQDDGSSKNNDGYDALLTELRPIIQSADIAFANLNSPIAPDNQYRLNSRYLNGPPSLLKALHQTGIDILSISNSHSFDQGKSGLRETLERIERSKITPIGAGRNCVDAKKAFHSTNQDIQVAFLAASTVFNNYIDSGVKNTCAFRIRKVSDIAPFIDNAKEKGADIVVVSIHWGNEYKTKPHRHIQQLAEQIIEAGADVILGHHPQVLQPIEIYKASDGRTGVIAYSLGSVLSEKGSGYQAFVQSDSQGNTRDSGILQLDIIKRDYGEEGIVTELNNVSFTPMWITHNPVESNLPAIFPRLIDDQILNINSEISLLESGDDRLYKKKELEFLFLRRNHIGETIGSEWLSPLLE